MQQPDAELPREQALVHLLGRADVELTDFELLIATAREQVVLWVLRLVVILAIVESARES